MLFRQSRISAKNLDSAREWATAGDPKVGPLAAIVAEIGVLYPGKRKRLALIHRNHPELWQRMIAAGIVEDWSEHETLAEQEERLGEENWSTNSTEEPQRQPNEQKLSSASSQKRDEEIPF